MSTIFKLGTPSILLAAALAAGLSPQAFGQDAVFVDDDASRCDIFRALSPQVPDECKEQAQDAMPTKEAMPKSLLVVETEPEPTGEIEPTPTRCCRIAQRLQFEFDSFELTFSAKQQLDKVADVLKDPLMAEKVFEIQGHADSVGSEDYNLKLSRNRAQAVQRYLNQRHGISTSRVPAVGKGETEPHDPNHPEDGINRRVEFVNLSDSEAG